MRKAELLVCISTRRLKILIRAAIMSTGVDYQRHDSDSQLSRSTITMMAYLARSNSQPVNRPSTARSSAAASRGRPRLAAQCSAVKPSASQASR